MSFVFAEDRVGHVCLLDNTGLFWFCELTFVPIFTSLLTLKVQMSHVSGLCLTLTLIPVFKELFCTGPRTSLSSSMTPSWEQREGSTLSTSPCGVWDKQDATCQVLPPCDHQQLLLQMLTSSLLCRVSQGQRRKGLLRDVPLPGGLLRAHAAGTAELSGAGQLMDACAKLSLLLQPLTAFPVTAASETVPLRCCHHLLWHPGCPSGQNQN